VERDAEDGMDRLCREAARAGTAENFLARWGAHAEAQAAVRRLAAAMERLMKGVRPGAVVIDDVAEMDAHQERLSKLAALLEGEVDRSLRERRPVEADPAAAASRRRAPGARAKRRTRPPRR